VIVDADLSGRRSVAVLYDARTELDVERVPGSVGIVRSKAGPFVMELARTHEDAFIQNADSVVEAIERLPEDAVIVVDAPQPFAAAVRPFIARAAKIVVITEPTLFGVGAARSMLSAMDRFGIPDARIAFVLNDVRASGELRRIDIERTLRVTVSAELPNERDRRFAKNVRRFRRRPRCIADLSNAWQPAPVNRKTDRRPARAPGGSRDADADARCA